MPLIALSFSDSQICTQYWLIQIQYIFFITHFKEMLSFHDGGGPSLVILIILLVIFWLSL